MPDYKVHFTSVPVHAEDEDDAWDKVRDDIDNYPSDWEISEDNSDCSIEEYSDGTPTDWVLIVVDHNGIQLAKYMDDWMKRPWQERNSELIMRYRDGQAVFKVLLTKDHMYTLALNNWCRDHEGRQHALSWLYFTMHSWCMTKHFRTMVWMALQPRERLDQIGLFIKYTNDFCVAGKQDKDYYIKKPFYGRWKKEAFEEWDAYKPKKIRVKKK